MSGPSADSWKLQLKTYRRFGVWGLSCRKLQRVRSVERFESSTWLIERVNAFGSRHYCIIVDNAVVFEKAII